MQLRSILSLLLFFAALVECDLIVASQRIRVAIQLPMLARAESPDEFPKALNLATFYNITATYLNDDQIVNTLSKLNYDVLVIGGSGNEVDRNNITLAAANTMISFAQNGGGIVTIGMLPTSLTDSTLISILQPIVPIRLSNTGAYGGCVPANNPEMGVTLPSHPIATSLPPYFSFNAAAVWSPYGMMPNTTSIASITGQSCTNLNAQTSLQGIVTGSFNNGGSRIAYLSPAYSAVYIYNSQNLRIGQTEQMLEASIWWASQIPAWCPAACQNRGRCVGPNNNCNCTGTGYTGMTCSQPYCAQGCINGNCTAPGYCTCATGYTGSSCQTATCNPPCRNNGQCIGVNLCNCTQLYTGTWCQNVNCSGTICYNGGSCVGGGNCTCAPGWNGTYCQNPICTIPCGNGTPCIGPNQCDCTATNFTGDQCTLPKCDPPCQNGNCTATNVCTCPTNMWQGSRCEIPICNPPCQNGRTCISPENSGVCACGVYYTGNRCQDPVCNPSCFHGGECVAPLTCDCNGTEYSGKFCEIPLPPPNNGTTEDTETWFVTNLPTYTTRSRASSSSTVPKTTETGLQIGSQPGTSGAGLSLTIIIIIAGGAALCCACFVGSFLVAMCCTRKHPKPENSNLEMMRENSVNSLSVISVQGKVDEDDEQYMQYH
eukprot:TRINITY_DN4041_c0_g1_i1.p1 TRINITY_DN4041_c0_g1~~TRINITY_DN4041_c0_g1_i1.p1  ORF type:complete len:656 (-),score=100.42 TRINITY_DN4041_c0_g1_i1:37-2004(-)